MILVADSSALIALSVCNILPLLEKLFKEVRVPEAVYIEVTQDNKPESKKLEQFLHDKIVQVNIEDYIITDFSIGKGELESIALYKKLNADRLLIDDKRARKLANLNGVRTIGSLGILLIAKEKGHIQQVAPLTEILKNSDIHIKSNLIDTVLALAGEK